MAQDIIQHTRSLPLAVIPTMPSSTRVSKPWCWKPMMIWPSWNLGHRGSLMNSPYLRRFITWSMTSTTKGMNFSASGIWWPWKLIAVPCGHGRKEFFRMVCGPATSTLGFLRSCIAVMFRRMLRCPATSTLGFLWSCKASFFGRMLLHPATSTLWFLGKRKASSFFCRRSFLSSSYTHIIRCWSISYVIIFFIGSFIFCAWWVTIPLSCLRRKAKQP